MKETIVYTSEMHTDDLINNLAAIRRFKNITQVEVGDRAGYAKSNVSRMEANVHSPSFNTLKSYIDALGVKFKIVLLEK
jgi:transcriptional regulator with XRE-family HTH domain